MCKQIAQGKKGTPSPNTGISAPGVNRLTVLPLEQGLIPAHCTDGDTAHIGKLESNHDHPFQFKKPSDACRTCAVT